MAKQTNLLGLYDEYIASNTGKLENPCYSQERANMAGELELLFESESFIVEQQPYTIGDHKYVRMIGIDKKFTKGIVSYDTDITYNGLIVSSTSQEESSYPRIWIPKNGGIATMSADFDLPNELQRCRERGNLSYEYPLISGLQIAPFYFAPHSLLPGSPFNKEEQREMRTLDTYRTIVSEGIIGIIKDVMGVDNVHFMQESVEKGKLQVKAR